MTHPVQSVADEDDLNVCNFCMIQNFIVCDIGIPLYLENGPKVPLLHGSKKCDVMAIEGRQVLLPYIIVNKQYQLLENERKFRSVQGLFIHLQCTCG